MLEVRLQELKDEVDFFVVVEAKKTFTNHPKALTFEAHKDRYAFVADKIIHVVLGKGVVQITTSHPSSLIPRPSRQFSFSKAALSIICGPRRPLRFKLGTSSPTVSS